MQEPPARLAASSGPFAWYQVPDADLARLPWVACLPRSDTAGTHPAAGRCLGREKEARVSGFYWERHPDGPFSTLIAVAAAYCSPGAYDGACADLISRAQAPGPGDEEIRVFTDELRQALADPGRLPGGELSAAADYDDGSDEAFLRRLRRDLSGALDE